VEPPRPLHDSRDLKKALDSGAMTQKEYDQERQKILERK
jgi:hypothetical protein